MNMKRRGSRENKNLWGKEPLLMERKEILSKHSEKCAISAEKFAYIEW